MAHRIWNYALFCFFCIFLGSGVAIAKTSEKWCVASEGASEKDLKVALDWACEKGDADCTAIQPGGSCYSPNTVRDHASYAFNDYYQKHPVHGNCVFKGTATYTIHDPSTTNCHYASPGSPSGGGPPSPSGGQPTPSSPASGGQPSPAIPTPSAPSPPSTFPTSAATSSFHSLPLLFISGLLATLQLPNYI